MKVGDLVRYRFYRNDGEVVVSNSIGVIVALSEPLLTIDTQQAYVAWVALDRRIPNGAFTLKSLEVISEA